MRTFVTRTKMRRLIARMNPGRFYLVRLPYSEACMHMGVAGKLRYISLAGEHMAQLNDLNMKPFSFPVTRGEAGVYTDDEGPYCYEYVESDEEIYAEETL